MNIDIDKYLKEIKYKFNIFVCNIKTESVETKAAYKLLCDSILKGKVLTKLEKESIGNQLKDVLKLIGFTAASILPGGIIYLLIARLTFMKKHLVPSAFISDKISYDFDGVLHKSVIGIHPIDMLDFDSWVPNNEIHDQLIHESLFSDIIIVTARDNSELNINAVNSFIKKYKLPIDIDKIYYTNGNSKVDILESLSVIKHYDDNIKMYDELVNSTVEFIHVK